MNYNLQGKVAVVTGASRGIGEATVRQLDAEGANVVLVSRSKDKLTAIADELQNEALVVDCDLAADRSIELIRIQTIEKFEKINDWQKESGKLLIDCPIACKAIGAFCSAASVKAEVDILHTKD